MPAFKTCSLLVAAALLVLASQTGYSQTIGASDTGWYESTGDHVAHNLNYEVGSSQSFGNYYRDYFAISLASIPQQELTITSATLTLWNPEYSVINGYTGTGSDVFDIYGVTGFSDSTLSSGSGGTAAYNALASGPILGSVTVTPEDNGEFVTVNLSSASALSFLNSERGGTVILGGDLPYSDFLFNGTAVANPLSNAPSGPDVFLTVSTSAVPEPATYGVIVSFLVLGFAVLRAKRVRPVV